jgi:hypothetical protein
MIAPPLAVLLRHVAERPPAARGAAHVPAVLRDLFEVVTGTAPPQSFLLAFRDPQPRWRTLVLAGAHLWWHPDLRNARPDPQGLQQFFVHDLAAMSAAVGDTALDDDVERREELVRLALRAVGASLPGESASEAADRLQQVDSVQRRRVLQAAAERERRAREVREAMARKAAEEAAAKVTRE